MPMHELDENQYAEYQRLVEITQLVQKNPKATRMLQEAIAEAAPDRIGPEIRIRNEVNEKLAGIEKMIADERAERAKEREERAAEEAKRDIEGRWLKGRSTLRAAGYNDEGISKIEELMEKRGVADHEVAAAYFERENPPPDPVVTGSQRFSFFDMPKDDVSLEALMKGDDEGFLRQAIPAALKDVRGG
jgi:hypothetical protein